MLISIFNILLFAIFGIPLMTAFIGIHHLKGNPRFASFAVAYLVFVVNEVFFACTQYSWYTVHVLVDCLVVSITCACMAFRTPEQAKRFTVQLSILGAGICGGCVMAFVQPAAEMAWAGVSIVTTFCITVYILIVMLDDRAVSYIKMISLWGLCHIAFSMQNSVLNSILLIGLALYLALHIGFGLLELNRQHFKDNALLKRARNVVFSMLSDISASGKNIPSLDYTIIRILETIIDTLSVRGAAVYTIEKSANGTPVLKFSQSAGIFWTMHSESNSMYTRTTFVKEDLTKKSFGMGESMVGLVAKKDEALSLDVAHNYDQMHAFGLNTGNIRTIMAVPLKVKKKMLGVLVIQNRLHESSFSSGDMHLLQSLADQAAIPMNNVQMYAELAKTDLLRQEMNIASDIQRQLLPQTVPAYQNLKVSVFMQPAKEVGGDYYDFIKNGDGSQGIVIGDVSGKGLPAGITMVIAKTVLQIVAQEQSNPKEIIMLFAKEMHSRMQKCQFMTLNYLKWEDTGRVLCYAGAGHEHILQYHRGNGFSEKIKVGGLAVGLVEDQTTLIKQNEIKAQPGDVFVLYTDGMTEARNKNQEMFTLERLLASLEKHGASGNAAVIIEKIKQDVFNFISGTEQYDDITLMVFSVS